jgi:hypothetical protein
MASLKLYRTPLAKGEVTYHLQRVHQGMDKQGQPLPKALVRCEILADGRLFWELPDNPENRAMLALSYSGIGPAPGSRYTVELPEGRPTAPPASRAAVADEIARVVPPVPPAAPTPASASAGPQPVPPAQRRGKTPKPATATG